MIPAGVGNIYLVGFMGSGKTTVGRLLAGQLGHAFLDLDSLIERRADASIESIFAGRGERWFREMESTVLTETTDPKPHVMALGGGAFSDPANRQLLRQRGWTAWLDVSAEEAWRRCSEQSGRPLAHDRDRFLDLFARRQADYRHCLLRVNADTRGPQMVCDELLAAVLERADSY